MTVTYTAQVATSSFSCFLRLLVRWRGSIYKLMWKDFALFAAIYYILALIYRLILTPSQRKTFELISRYCEAHNNLIPVAFVLGFFVTLIINRWWNHIVNIPFPERMAIFVMAGVQGDDERGRLMRRTIMRYMCLSYVIMMSSISTAVKKRFPTFQNMTDAGFMLSNEQKIVENIKTQYNKFFVPLVWAASLVRRARKEGRIGDDMAVQSMNNAIVDFRAQLANLWVQDWQTVPLVYTQVVTLAVYTFFFSCLMGRQFLYDQQEVLDMYFPVFTFLQFFFYMGWLKVGESMINPFGQDDQDIELNFLIDKNLQCSYLIVDEMHNDHPELVRDQYWDEVQFSLPYTAGSEHLRTKAYLGSTMNLHHPDSPRNLMRAITEEDYDIGEQNNDNGSCSPPFHAIPRSSNTVFGMIAGSLRSAGGGGGRSWHLPRKEARSRSLCASSAAAGGSSRPCWSRELISPAQMLSSPGSVTSPTTHDCQDQEEIFNMSDLELYNDGHNVDHKDSPQNMPYYDHSHYNLLRVNPRTDDVEKPWNIKRKLNNCCDEIELQSFEKRVKFCSAYPSDYVPGEAGANLRMREVVDDGDDVMTSETEMRQEQEQDSMRRVADNERLIESAIRDDLSDNVVSV